MERDKIVAVHSFPVWLPQTQTWMYTQVKHLPEFVESHVVCERTENLDQFNVKNIHSLQTSSRSQYFWEKILRNMHVRYLARFLVLVTNMTNADIVHSHFGHIGWSNLEAVKRTLAKHIVSFYGTDASRLPAQGKQWKLRYRELFDKADLFLCEGPHMAEQLIALGCIRSKLIVHRLGIEVKAIPYRPRVWQAREPLRVLIAASFREKKGIPYALKALAQLQDVLTMQITIIGDAGRQAQDRKEKLRIMDIINASGLKPNTRLLGQQPHSVLFDEAYRHHIFISPSITASDGDTEGGAPVSLIEMMATGMPVVSTLHCDIPQVVRYGIDDWLVAERDVSGLVDRLAWLIKQRNDWGGFLRTGRDHIELEFDAVGQGRQLEQIYRSILRN
ncbi:MAG: glycosyltransferase [Chloroflexota bacterium]